MSKRTKDIRKMTFSDFYCTQCGMKNFPILRQQGKEKEPGHLKKMFCLNCQKEHNMVEIKTRSKYTLDHFLLEYNNHNFDEQGNRKEDWKNFCKRMNKNE